MSLSVTPDPVLPEVLQVRPVRHGDARGWFSETYSEAAFRAAGIAAHFIQDNHSRSAEAGTLRGLHYQAPPVAQAKLVRVARGAILDVAVDVRRDSPRYGRWVAQELSAATGAQILVPHGFLHGFLTLVDETLVSYLMDNPHDSASEGAVAWDDPDLGIAWGIDPGRVILSARDRAAPPFATWVTPFPGEPEP
jgi:dTDP-4-dehydrorhamnose 3,5-epimerase